MKKLSVDTVKHMLKADIVRDNTNTLKSATHVYELDIESVEFLRTLVFPYHSNTQLVTPRGFLGGRYYTVEQVMDHFFSLDQSFQELAERTDVHQHEREWWARCHHICESFDMAKFGIIILRQANRSEMRQCPHSSFRILDGLHRVMTVVWLVSQSKINFQSIKSLVVIK